MKKIIFVLFLLNLNISGFSQIHKNYHLNSLDWYILQKENIADTNFHFSVIDYNFIDKKVTFHSKKNIYLQKLYKFPSLIYYFKDNTDSNLKFISASPISNISFSYNKKNNEFYSDLKGGLSVFGQYSDKIKFNIDAFVSQKSFPDYIEKQIDSSGIIPHYGKFSEVINGNYAYFSPTGFLLYTPAKYINFEIGRDKTFWGHGERSLLLSDNSNAYPYFKSTVNIWRVKYIYMISKLKDFDSDLGFDILQNKYSVQHYLSINLTKWLNFDFFEAVIASTKDALGANRGFDVNYLNPVIFFRPVEFSIGTSDNVLMGFGGSLKLGTYHQFYGQFILDEFILSHIKARDGWWGNKNGLQAGFKSFKAFFIPDLYAQIEINYVRPFTYSHYNSIRNWGNNYQPMAHPLGANFKELIGILRYNFDDLYLSSKVVYANYGTDIDTLSVGQNIYRSYADRSKETGNFIGQGLSNKNLYGELKASYLLIYSWNLFLESSVSFRQHTFNSVKNNDLLFTLGIKTLLFNENYEY